MGMDREQSMYVGIFIRGDPCTGYIGTPNFYFYGILMVCYADARTNNYSYDIVHYLDGGLNTSMFSMVFRPCFEYWTSP